MTDIPDRRLISGKRFICKCSLVLPKIDPFSPIKTDQKGFIVMNTRGGSLYLPNQFSSAAVVKMFVDGQPSLVKNFTLYPPQSEAVILGHVSARFLRFTDGEIHKGMVLRFRNFTERQLDTVNSLIKQLPDVKGEEERVVSFLMKTL